MDAGRAEHLGLPWLAEIGSYGTVAGPDPSLLHQPAGAIRDALRRDGTLEGTALDLIEINEAFAAVVLASTRELGLAADRVNVNGGAIALGHPIGMSGARLVLTLALELRRRGGGVGAAALCGGGAQGDALILRVPAAEWALACAVTFPDGECEEGGTDEDTKHSRPHSGRDPSVIPNGSVPRHDRQLRIQRAGQPASAWVPADRLR
jgi:hypothetical protein